jgi:hypothetical protein
VPAGKLLRYVVMFWTIWFCAFGWGLLKPSGAKG